MVNYIDNLSWFSTNNSYELNNKESDNKQENKVLNILSPEEFKNLLLKSDEEHEKNHSKIIDEKIHYLTLRIAESQHQGENYMETKYGDFYCCEKYSDYSELKIINELERIMKEKGWFLKKIGDYCQWKNF